ncbi:LOW QUALITY PROTEIN: B-cell receptor CD22-like [Osmerus mordax]|uniref:LOW QUALITY PROTEIN: B-cell receptor CD22-like n=1 Tax=Osmerus mordax TaxID=8014 RepID=UPI00350F033F
MELRTTGSVFVVFLCSVAVVLGQDWGVTYTLQSVCALRGSSVDLSCSYTYPSGHTVTKTEWCKWKNDQEQTYNIQDQPEYAGRVQYLGDKDRDCTLTITDLRETDSAFYYFRFKTTSSSQWMKSSQGISLSVTALQVTVTRYSKTLTCRSTCTLTGSVNYIWYKNNQDLKGETRNKYSKYVYEGNVNSYSCAVEGHEDLHSPAVCVSGQNCWSVNYPTRRVCVLRGSSVDISSTYTHPSYKTNNTFWFKWDIFSDLKDYNEYTGRVKYLERKVNHHILRITDLRESDSAEYKFRVETDGGGYAGYPGVQLTVTDIKVEIEQRSVTEGDKVLLTCKTKCSVSLNTSWFRNGQLVTNRNTQQKLLYLDSVSSEDAGRYSCAVTEHQHLRSPEETLNVTYKPRNISVSVSPSGEVVEGSSVTLTCSSDANPPVQTYTWYQENITSSKSSGQSYTITNISSEDSGQYWCRAQNDVGDNSSHGVLINVLYKPRNVYVSVSPSGEVVEGSSVTLTCSSDANPPVQTYTWYQENITSSKSSGQSYTITNISSEDSGQYWCRAQNDVGDSSSHGVLIYVLYKPRNVYVSVSPSGEVVEGSSVTLTCSSDANPPVQTYTWYQENINLSKSSGQSYTITNIRSEDSGGYYCQAGNTVGVTNSSVVMITLLTAVSPWSPVLLLVLLVSGLAAGGLLVLLCCTLKRRSNTGTDVISTGQTVQADPSSDTYTALNLKNMSPDYDTLPNVRDSSSDTYSSLDMRTRSSDYNTLASLRRTGTEI